jgi:endonuclease-3
MPTRPRSVSKTKPARKASPLEPSPTNARPVKARAGDARARIGAIIRGLAALYPDVKCELDHQNAFQLLCATILSAQCTDVRVNMVTPTLFGRWPDAHALAAADQGAVEEVIRSTGFFRNKAKNLIGMARGLVERHEGEVPREMGQLLELPGVARKTANVVLGTAFGIASGVVVDTHVMRLSRLLGLSRNSDPVKIEQDLAALVPQAEWINFSHRLIWHGRRVCIANRPRCDECPLPCPSRLVALRKP